MLVCLDSLTFIPDNVFFLKCHDHKASDNLKTTTYLDDQQIDFTLIQEAGRTMFTQITAAIPDNAGSALSLGTPIVMPQSPAFTSCKVYAQAFMC